MNMCPLEEVKDVKENSQGDSEKYDRSSGAQPDSPEMAPKGVVGYRSNMGPDGVCMELKEFGERVKGGDFMVGDFDHKTRLLKRVAGGSFGEVYIGERVDTGEQVAVKVEAQRQGVTAYLLYEGNVYRAVENCAGLPKVHWFGYHGSGYTVMILDKLGHSLHDLFVACGRKFSLKTVLQILDQMIDILEQVHKKGYVHRDMSPGNFMMGAEQGSSRLHLIDFGYAKRYNQQLKMLPRRNSTPGPRAVVGTPRFIGVHVHLGHPDAPRDDLESLAYILIFFQLGRLPWQGMSAVNMQEKIVNIGNVKMAMSYPELCQDLPEEFSVFLDYTRNIRQFDDADYAGIKQLFRNLADKHNIEYDGQYDWTVSATGDAENTAPSLIESMQTTQLVDELTLYDRIPPQDAQCSTISS